MQIGNLFISHPNEKPGVLKVIINLLILCATVVVILLLSLKSINVVLDFSFLPEIRIRLEDAFLMTVGLSVCSLVCSLLIGSLSSSGYQSPILIIRYLCIGYVKFIRGTPLLMQIYLFFYILGTAWGITNRFLSGVMILSIFEGAYISEIIRGSFISIEESQKEAGRAAGFSKIQILRYVVLPQMIARTLPALTGQFASIIKDSSLLSVIAIVELTQTMREISALNFRLFECYFVLGILYLCLTLPITFISERLERRYRYEN